MALVIKSWYAQETVNSNGEYVSIIAREEGFLSWLFSLVGIDPITSLSVTRDTVVFQQGSLAGFKSSEIPIRRISSAIMDIPNRGKWPSFCFSWGCGFLSSVLSLALFTTI